MTDDPQDGDEFGQRGLCLQNGGKRHEFEPGERPDVICVRSDAESGDGYGVQVDVRCTHCGRTGTVWFMKIDRDTYVRW